MMNERQRRLLLFISRNRFCTFKEIHAYLGGDGDSIRDSLRIFKADGVSFIKICEQDRDERIHLRPNHYEIDDRGVVWLAQEGLITEEIQRPRISNFKHATLATHGTASFEAGIEACPHATLITWPDIKASKNIPEKTRDALHPFGIPYADKDGVIGHAYADSPPFGFKLALPDHNKFRFFPGIEADTGTKNREKMIEQFQGYLDIEHTHAYAAHFGFPKFSFYVPFLVKSLYEINRVQWLIDILMDITDGKGSKMILFMPYDPKGEPGYLFTRPWIRAGHDTILLGK